MNPISKPAGFSGEFIRPDDPDFESEYRTFIWMKDRRPAAIACCRTREDVVAALAAAREHGLEIAIRSGRHSVPGFSSTDGGLLIDIAALKSLEIDPEKRTARVGAGVLGGEFLPKAAELGLAPVSGSEVFPSYVGLAIHGGRGLFRRHGWASDRIIGATLITAAGKTVSASTTENPELLYGIRGAGSNFGVVVELEVELVPVPREIRGGKLLYDQSGLRKILPGILGGLDDGSFSDGLGVTLTSFVTMERTLLELTVCHLDEPEDAAGEIDRILAIADPIDGEIGLLAYDKLIAQTELIDIPRVYWAEQGSDVPGLDLAAALVEEIEMLPKEASEMPSRLITVEPFGPGFETAPATPTPVPRRSGSSVAFFSAWIDPAKDEEMIGWARGGWQRLREVGVGNGVPVLNYNSRTGPEGVEKAYGPEAFRRLQALKKVWDPENVFHRNHNVPPA